MHLGYLVSGFLFAVLFALPAIAYYRFGLAAIPAFWASYVVTRPLGASFADWMAVPPSRGGLGWGTGPVTLAFCVLIIGFVGYLALTRRDVSKETLAVERATGSLGTADSGDLKIASG